MAAERSLMSLSDERLPESLAMTTACWWWGIIICANFTSASLNAPFADDPDAFGDPDEPGVAFAELLPSPLLPLPLLLPSLAHAASTRAPAAIAPTAAARRRPGRLRDRLIEFMALHLVCQCCGM